ncbi:MAG: hypothetical protein ACI7YS_02545 [Flavobacterium sp.]
MKNILYSLLTTLLFCNFSFAQLMSDAAHKTMMDTYSVNLTNVLTGTCPQGMSIDQYKRGIVKGSYTLSPTAKSNITAYAAQLKTYGAAFATAKGLVANTDALKYFYSTFMPSTVVLGGTIVESTTAPGLRGLEMWNCALKSFNAENCGSTLLIGDENNLSELADISVNILKLPTEDPTNPENMGMLVMLNGFGECMQKYFQLEQVAFNVSRHANFANLVNRIDWFSNQTVNQVRIDELIAAERALTTSELSDLAVSLGFQNTQALNDFGCNTETDINIIKGSITSVASEDEIVVLNSASKYYPDQTKIHVPSEVQGGNLGIATLIGNCDGDGLDLINNEITFPEFKNCLIKVGKDTLYLMGGLITLIQTGNPSIALLTETAAATLSKVFPYVTVSFMMIDLGFCLYDANKN